MKAPIYVTTKTYLGILFILFTLQFSFSQIPAFPGAEGFGKYATGGRGGQVYRVTNLNDSGPGSLREACEASGPRTVVFDVGGRIDLLSPINITNSNITIAGQTSPGDGIMITGAVGEPDRLININADDVIIRYLTLRRSESSTGFNAGDCMMIYSGSNIMIDHCSMSWSSDGNLDIVNYEFDLNNRVLDNITVQYCLFTNSYGGNNKSNLLKGSPSTITWFRNAHINSKERNPAIASEDGNYQFTFDGYYEVANCLFYDASSVTSYANRSDSNMFYLNYLNNIALQEDGGSYSRRMLRFTDDNTYAVAYLNGNVDGEGRPDPTQGGEWDVAQLFNGSQNKNNPVPAYMRSDNPIATPLINDNVQLWDALDLATNLLPVVGNYINNRDAEDERAVNDVINGTSTFNNANNVFPIYNNGTPLPDVDDDGMPDPWEINEFGDLTSNGVVDTDGDGYTDLEEYLNQTANDEVIEVPAEGVAVTPTEATINIPETIDLDVIFTPASTTNQSGLWTSSDGNVATVSQSGIVTPLNEGVTTITFTSNDGNFSDSSIITVTNITIDAESIVLNTDQLLLDIGQTETVDVIFTPVNTSNQNGVWISDNALVADVDENGAVTGVSEGLANISFTSDDGGFVDIVQVTVEETFFGTYELYNADTDALIQTIQGDESFDLSVIGNQINLRSIPENGDNNPEVESVTVNWVGPSSGSYTESTPLYAGMAEHVGFDFFPYTVQEGTYDFTVIYYSQDDATGDITATDTFSLTFFFDGPLNANAGEDQTICEGEITTLTASGGTGFLWSTGETTPNIQVSPNETATYTVTVSNSNGEEDSDSVTIFVDALPTLSISEDVTILEGETVNLSANSNSAILWNTGETGSSITVSPNQTTTYTVTATNGVCEVQEQITVTVIPEFVASAGDDERVCQNDEYVVELTATSGDSYLWNTGEITQSIFVSPLSTTTYSVTVTLGNQQDTDDVTVYVDPNPNVVIANGESVDILNGDFITLSASGANTYEWSNGATQPNIAVSPSQTTTYQVRGFINDCYDEKQVTVNVYQPVVADAGEDAFICLGESATLTATGGDEFLWSTGETTQSIQVAPEITTDYTVTVFNAMDFDESTVRVEVNANCNINQDNPSEIIGDFSFDIFPNPANNILNVRVNGSLTVSDVQIYDVMGKRVLVDKIENETASPSLTEEINITSLNAGIYFVKLIDNDKEITKKLIVQ